MDQVDSGDHSATPPGARPSLFANGQSAPATASKQPEAISILSSLDKNGGKKPLRSGTGLPTWFTIAMGALLGITIGAAIILSLSEDTGIGRRTPVTPMVVASTAVPEKAPGLPASATVPAPTAPSPGGGVNATAAIENAPPAALPPTTSPSASAQPPVSPAPEADKKSAATPSEPAASAGSQTVGTTKATSAPALAAPTETATTSRSQTAASEHSETKADKTSTGKKAKTRTTDGKAESTTTVSAPSDRDASLLAALVAYGEGRPAADINSQAAPIPNKSTSAKSSKTPAVVAQAGTGQFDPKRDVVLREPTVGTAELVRRCKTLGFFEGLLCRMRVCSNLWGKDPSCPQGSAPVDPNSAQ